MRLPRKLGGGNEGWSGVGRVIKNASIFCCFVAVTFPLLPTPLCRPQIHFIHICHLPSFIELTYVCQTPAALYYNHVTRFIRHAPFVSHIKAILSVICTRVGGKCFPYNITDPPEPLCFLPLCHTHF